MEFKQIALAVGLLVLVAIWSCWLWKWCWDLGKVLT